MDMSFERPVAEAEEPRDEGRASGAPAPQEAAPAKAASPEGSRQCRIVLAILLGLPIGLVAGLIIAVVTGILPILC